MYDVVTIGSAVKDVYLKGDVFKKVKTRKSVTGKLIGLDFGCKLDLKDIVFEAGGGGTNAAVTFANLGLRTAFFGKVGDDYPGRQITDFLRGRGVKVLAKVSRRHKTGYSLIIAGSKGERSILIYRGANNDIVRKDVPYNKMKARWFYITSLSDNSARMFPDLIKFARKNNIKVAANPSKFQIKKYKEYFSSLDVLLMNREEASLLARERYNNHNAIYKKVCGISRTNVITDGARGAVVCGEGYKYKIKAKKVKVVDMVGAGDAFGSAFVAGMIKRNNIEFALRLGTLNAASVIQELGAKKGLLSRIPRNLPRIEKERM